MTCVPDAVLFMSSTEVYENTFARYRDGAAFTYEGPDRVNLKRTTSEYDDRAGRDLITPRGFLVIERKEM